ncbi:MAG: M14 family zinc carboxypeptidase [Phycisphaerales bacterium]
MRHLALLALAALTTLTHAQPGPANHAALKPSTTHGLTYTKPLFTRADGQPATYDPAIPTPASVLGYEPGNRAASHAEIERVFKSLDGKGANNTPRAKLLTHGQTWEGRTLLHLIITSPENLARLDDIQKDIQRLYDQRKTSRSDADRIEKNIPAVAWMAYSIHGDETSGADAAVALAHHLVASTDPETTELLKNLVVVIDPMMNPDGRDRFLKMLSEHRAANPNLDDQSLLHAGYWPAGRTNHYGFDLNRDWIFATQPETKGRLEAVKRWRPQLFVDAHEMWSQDTFLFSPPREPTNPFHTKRIKDRLELFAANKAKAFDAHGWRYYTGEWNEGWYPGYSDAWAAFSGAIPILYEQARYAEDAVRLQSGALAPYREAVHKQAAASLADLRTLSDNRADILKEYAAERRAALSDDGPLATRAWIIPLDADPAKRNTDRLARFIDWAHHEGIELGLTTKPARLKNAVDSFGRAVPGDAEPVPAGAIVVPARQPAAYLVAALMQRDPRMSDDYLKEERREILRDGASRLYDITAWSIPHLFALDAIETDAAPLDGSYTLAPARDALAHLTPTHAARAHETSPIGWSISAASDASVAAAARMMEVDIRVRITTKQRTRDGERLSPPKLWILRSDNPSMADSLDAAVAEVCAALGLTPEPVPTGFAPGAEPPDLGSEHFPLLTRPRIAILSRGRVSPNSMGEAWLWIDQRLGLRASLIDITNTSYADLRRYNVIIVPSLWGGELHTATDALKTWIQAGGTLIAIGSSARSITSTAENAGLSGARTIDNALDDLDEYEQAVLREFVGRRMEVELGDPFAEHVGDSVTYPWNDAPDRPSKEERKRRDDWSEAFMPSGVVLAARTDDRHWLTIGCPDEMPVLHTGDAVLMAKPPVQAAIRFGVYEPAPDAPKDSKDDASKKDGESKDGEKSDAPKRARAGWAMLPAGQQLRLRLAGLLWPEASQRIANTAYVTRERVGNGQIILFASDPLFRAATLGTARIFTNAVVYGPGLGAQEPIIP